MVKIFKFLTPMTCGAICSFAYALLYLMLLANAFIRNDAEPQLVLAFVGFPMSWLFISIFHPLLNWLGPFGATERRIAEWILLGFAGFVQYWLVGAALALLIRSRTVQGVEEIKKK